MGKPLPPATGQPVGLYVHIPFCERKCEYCDFNSGAYAPEVRERYVQALLSDIRAASFPERQAGSVFLGGGTPSVLPAKAIADILDALRQRFRILPDAEVTVECNPGTIASERMAGETTDDFLAGLRSAGVNRISFGVQSLDAGILRRLGRIHGPEQALRSIEAAQRAGFANLNVDLMFALPGQDLTTWLDSLRRIVDTGVPHISAYSLIVEPETPFALWDQQGRLPRPEEEEEIAMYEAAMDLLGSAGYEHYEVSAFAKPGFRCRHNTTYWRNEQYLGFGVGATSYLDGVRFTRVADLERYVGLAETGGDTAAEHERLDARGTMGETMMMGLRLLDGVDRRAFRQRFGPDPLDAFAPEISRLQGAGLLQTDDRSVRLTHRGLMLANEVWEAFV